MTQTQESETSNTCR